MKLNLKFVAVNLIITGFFWPSLGSAQIYTGGTGDGYGVGETNNLIPVTSYFYGGIGDGYVLSATDSIIPVTSYFLGGIGDGHDTDSTINVLPVTSYFYGGNGDGYDKNGSGNILPVTSYFYGGTGDGYAMDSMPHSIQTFILRLKAYLEGPYNNNTGKMCADLNPDFIPHSQPYNSPPWNYSGSEYINSIPDSNIVDWVLIELRDTVYASQASGSTNIARQAAFIRKDGFIVGTNGTDDLYFNKRIEDSLFAVLWHRNHLGVMSSYPLNDTCKIHIYDFSGSAGQAYGGTLAHKEIDPGVWGLMGGDGNADGQISNTDKNEIWVPQADSSGYHSGDFSMDGQVNNPDRNEIWAPNSGSGGQVPDLPNGKPD